MNPDSVIEVETVNKIIIVDAIETNLAIEQVVTEITLEV